MASLHWGSLEIADLPSIWSNKSIFILEMVDIKS